MIDRNGEPEPGAAVRHIKTGGYYTVVCMATEEATERRVVVYRSHSDGRTWTRPLSEFMDGRFETQFGHQFGRKRQTEPVDTDDPV